MALPLEAAAKHSSTCFIFVENVYVQMNAINKHVPNTAILKVNGKRRSIKSSFLIFFFVLLLSRVSKNKKIKRIINGLAYVRLTFPYFKQKKEVYFKHFFMGKWMDAPLYLKLPPKNWLLTKVIVKHTSESKCTQNVISKHIFYTPTSVKLSESFFLCYPSVDQITKMKIDTSLTTYIVFYDNNKQSQ